MQHSKIYITNNKIRFAVCKKCIFLEENVLLYFQFQSVLKKYKKYGSGTIAQSIELLFKCYKFFLHFYLMLRLSTSKVRWWFLFVYDVQCVFFFHFYENQWRTINIYTYYDWKNKRYNINNQLYLLYIHKVLFKFGFAIIINES